MNDRPQIDPRYDPAFQRGFTGEVQTGQHPHGVVRSQHPQAAPVTQTVQAPTPPTPAASPAPRAEPLTGSSIPPAYATAGSDARTGEYAGEFDDTVIAPGLGAADEVAARPLTRNPFLIALTLIGAALMVAGTSWAITGRATMTDSGALASERDYWFVQAALLGAPVLIASGVLIIAGVLFVFANAWNRARPKDDASE